MKFLKALCLIFLSTSANSFAQATLPPAFEVRTDTVAEQELGESYWQMLEDPSGKIGIHEITKAPLSEKFHASQKIDYSIHTFWVRFRLKNIMDRQGRISLMYIYADYVDVFLSQDGKSWDHKTYGMLCPWDKKDGLKRMDILPLTLDKGEELSVYLRVYVNYYYYIDVGRPEKLSINLASTQRQLDQFYNEYEYRVVRSIRNAFLFGVVIFGIFFNIFFFWVARERIYIYFALYLLFFGINVSFGIFEYVGIFINHPALFYSTGNLWWPLYVFFLIYFIRSYFQTAKKIPRWDKFLLTVNFYQIFIRFFGVFAGKLLPVGIGYWMWQADSVSHYVVIIFVALTILYFIRQPDLSTRLFTIAALPWLCYRAATGVAEYFLSSEALDEWLRQWGYAIEVFCICWWVIFFSWILFRKYKQLQKENIQNALERERIAKEMEIERSRLIAQQKEELETQVIQRTRELKQSLEELKSAQAQLVQSEKMASLGELTAGIAHEIQNPLNFVTNFSEVNNDLINELKSEKRKEKNERDESLEDEILNDIHQNLEKINHHGKRADAIVKGMLQHSRSSSGTKEPTDINALADEYLRLSYHGLRAKDKTFNANYETDFDSSIGKINIVPQDIGRVILNFINNAFYAVNEKQKLFAKNLPAFDSYEPMVTIGTKKSGNQVSISVRDNGNGIPKKAIDKIFQPFFTTKPTGQGTGLGLSLSYDIVKAHGGEIKVETKEGEGSEFIIQLPVV